MRTVDLDVLVTRGDVTESRHAVHAAVVDSDGRLMVSAGSPDVVAPWRSCAKPLQVYPFVESGQFDAIGWGADALALACASHGGEPEHVALASDMLRSIGLQEDALACGPHEPLSERGAEIVRHEGGGIGRLHNNCSGKHAAMLASCVASGWPTAGYADPDHAIQRLIRRKLARWTGLADGARAIATDGCGVPVFVLALHEMALAYAHLAVAGNHELTAQRILDAMGRSPFLVGGTGRFDTVLIDATAGRVIAKIGAEGVHTVLLRDRGIAFALKVADGSARAQYPAVLRLLQHLDALPIELDPTLQNLLVSPVRDTRGHVVGEVRPAA